jgi:hypothetical protein
MKIPYEDANSGQLSLDTMKLAVRELSDVGFVILEQVVAPSLIETARAAFQTVFEQHIQQPDIRARIDKGAKYIGMRVPFVPPFSDSALCANPLAVQVMEAVMGKFACKFYNSNTTLPGAAEFQPIHIDMPSLLFPGLPVALPPWLIVVNFPLIDFTVENGGTEIWPGTHLNTDASNLAERCASLPSIRSTVRVGDLVIRDLRTWHRGAPNYTSSIRTMLAVVYHRPWFHMTPPFVEMSRSTLEALPDYARSIFADNPIIEPPKEGVM